jgi:molybdopterin synthase sulfur carrier subunit
MNVNFYATLRLITGRKTLCLDHLPDGVTVRDVLEECFKLYPPLRAELMKNEHEMLGHVHFFVNGRDVPYLPDVLETKVSRADKLDVFPAVGGG